MRIIIHGSADAKTLKALDILPEEIALADAAEANYATTALETRTSSSARAPSSPTSWPTRETGAARCCNEYLGSDFENEVRKPAKPFAEYQVKIKALLASRGHVPTPPAKKPAAKGKKYDVKFRICERWGGESEIRHARVTCASTKKTRSELTKSPLISGVEILEVNGRAFVHR